MAGRGPPRRSFAAAVLLAAGASPCALAEVRFTEVAAAAGVHFKHVNGMVGERWLVEIMGAGVGLVDFDGDGLLDIYLVQGGPLRERNGALPCDRLYRQLPGGQLRFRDMTEAAGVCADGYGMGVAAGDIDNDGDADLFVANFGPNQLLENLGDGRWRDATAAAGVAGDAWSVSASFVDFDGDGRLDLYVGNYLDFSFAERKRCTDNESRPSYCSPEVYEPARDRLFRNLGGGRFEDVTRQAGIGTAGPALGVVARDFNGDGRPDIFVANDMADNLLWLNQGDGAFKDNALFAGVAVNGDGMAEASMGIAAEDFDGDCDVDLFLTHLAVQTNTLYVNNGRGWFTDRSNVAGVAAASIPDTGFGAAWFDADGDGDLDLFSANGAVTAIAGQAPGALGLPLRQPNRLWLNGGRGRYRAATGIAAFDVEEVSRGTALGDLDNDGDLDLVVANNRGPARIYRNDSEPGGHWLGIALAGGGSAWPTAGSQVRLEGAVGGPCTLAHAATDGSYGSANDPRVVFGLGAKAKPRHVRVVWPDGAVERFGPLTVDRYHTLRRAPTE